MSRRGISIQNDELTTQFSWTLSNPQIILRSAFYLIFFRSLFVDLNLFFKNYIFSLNRQKSSVLKSS
jgi:hypothetical protein